MRIHIFSLGFNLVSGGGSHYTLDLILRSLVDRGHRVSLTTLYSDNNAIPSHTGYEVFEEHISGGFREFNSRLADLLSTRDADIFLLYGPALIWGGGIYRKNGGQIPTAVYINNYLPEMMIHHPMTAKARFYGWKRRIWSSIVGLRIANHLDAFLYVSPIVKEIYKHYGYEDSKAEVVPDFIDVKEFEALRQKAEQPQPVSFLYTGRVMYDKGIDLLIKAFSAVAKDRECMLEIVGKGPQQKEIEHLIKEKNLGRQIRLHEWTSQKDLARFYNSADIFIHPCRWPEPFGRTVAEAMCFGLPAIITEKTGSAWVAGDSCLTFKNSDISGLERGMRTMLDDKILRQKLGSKALVRAQLFDYRQTVKKLEKIFELLVQKHTYSR